MAIALHLISVHAGRYIKQHLMVTGKLKLFKIQTIIETVRYHQDQVLYFRVTFFPCTE